MGNIVQVVSVAAVVPFREYCIWQKSCWWREAIKMVAMTAKFNIIFGCHNSSEDPNEPRKEFVRDDE